MVFLLYGLSFAIGFVFCLICFSGSRSAGTFETKLLREINNGKRVVIGIEKDVYIFETINNKVRITHGIADLFGEVENDNVASDGSTESTSNPKNGTEV